MGNFNRGNRPGGRGFGNDRGGNRRFSGGRDRDRVEMYKTVCSDCGNSCEVPFRPTGDKPVFCSDCFKGKGGDNSRNFRDGGRGDFNNRGSRLQQNRSTMNYKADFEKLNTKLDKILKILVPTVSEESEKALKRKSSSADVKKIVKKMIKKSVVKKVATKKTTAKKAVAKKKK